MDKKIVSGRLKIDTFGPDPRFYLVNNEEHTFPDYLWFYSDIFENFQNKKIMITIEDLED